MKLASHNSWSYLRPKKWWMRLIGFTAKCQEVSIQEQYDKYGVRCFDLRLSIGSGGIQVNHGIIVYSITLNQLMDDLRWLEDRGDVSIRVLLDVRKKKAYNMMTINTFRCWCNYFSKRFNHIKFWGGRNLYNWQEDYKFEYNPSCEEKYASVCSPQLIDDWCPKLYAELHTKELYEKGTTADYLMLDFVNFIV